ncbi:type VII secretion-associated serine protease mycosin [Solwaraspora sp. WMMD406]|uniref:type VII secretion-associated serine protease mycosin n=1 Tax=Solwaraspora sp. WMMD406 TaxID=3016095 RepID=UPI0024171C0A|nr:type VII secretion-associated serine protease mycosin [Solwaraspora sp. WMMD406]MDG4762756.1 type VII secretion-associated serine protease mycosin [Solwaraspora sp. WMMD406]
MRGLRGAVALLSTLAVGQLAAIAVLPASARADAIREQAWHLTALELAELHQLTQGEGITVAVVDTGVDANHPDLVGNVLPGVDLHDDTTQGQVDRQIHGTGMASLIAGHGHGPGNGDGVLGIAPKARILPITVVPEQGLTSSTMIAAGINWAVDKGADVINVSMATGGDPDLDDAVERAYRSGVVVVASVGNREDVLIADPARHPAVMAVTGSDRAGGLGPESIPADEIALAAPSVDLTAAAPGGGYVTVTSTSGATAIVSGAVALVRARFPDLSPYDVFKRVLETTTDAGPPGRDPDFGWGVLDLRRALTGEPDGRADAAASPTPTDNETAYAWDPGTEDERWYSLVVLVGLLLVLAVPVTGAVLLLRWRRRRRRGRSDQRPGPGGAAAPTPAGSAPGRPADDRAWRRPAP